MRRKINSALRHSGGNIGVICALALTPIMLSMGIAIDYTRKSSASTQVQAALDSAALAAARLPLTTSAAEMQRYGEAYLRGHKFDGSLTINKVSITRDANSITATSASTLETSLMKVAGFGDMSFSNVSRVGWQQTPVEIAFVIDVSGSMNDDGRLAAAREAAASFFDDLKELRDVKVSLVSYNHLVRVKPDVYRNASWIEYDGPEWYVPIPADYPPPLPASKPDWTGCLAEREMPNNTNLSKISGTRYWASRCGEILPVEELTTNLTLLREKALALKAWGYTNMTLGISMGAATLAPDGPFPHTAAPYNTTEKRMVLLIDGGNTASRHRGMTDEGAPPHMNDDTRKLCAEVHKAGIIVYGVRFMSTDPIIEECASPGNFQNITDTTQLKPALNKIFQDIMAIRLTH